MDKKKRDQIIRDIKKLKNNIVAPKESHQFKLKNTRTIAKDGYCFSLIGEYIELYIKIINDVLQQDEWGRKISKKYAEDRFNSLLVKLSKDGNDENATEYFEDLIKDFETVSSKECVVFLPVFGISMELNSIKFGKIKLVRLTDEKISEIKALVRTQYLKTANNLEEKEYFIRKECERIDMYLKEAESCAEFYTFAETNRAVELIDEEAQRVIDIFRYAIPALYARNLNVFIGLQGEYSRQDRYVFASCGDHFVSSLSNVGALGKFEINLKNLKQMKNLNIFKLNKIIRNDDRNDFEDTLLLGLKWFSRSQTHKEPINQFMDLITCIEVFLNPGKGQPTTLSLTEGLAILLTDDVIERKKIKAEFDKLYLIRSNIAHGVRESIEDKDMNYLIGITGLLISLLTDRKDEFENKKSLINWLEFNRLGGKPEEWAKHKEFFKNYKKSKPN